MDLITNEPHAEREKGKLLFKCLIKILNVSSFEKQKQI